MFASVSTLLPSNLPFITGAPTQGDYNFTAAQINSILGVLRYHELIDTGPFDPVPMVEPEPGGSVLLFVDIPADISNIDSPCTIKIS